MYSANSNAKSDFVVETARQAREERALKRRKECAALCIQCAFRGFLCRKTLRKQWICELDDLVGCTAMVENEQETRKNQTSSGSDVKHSVPETSEKITHSIREKSSEQWKYASFGSNTLTGAYGNFSCTSLHLSTVENKLDEQKQETPEDKRSTSEQLASDQVQSNKNIVGRSNTTDDASLCASQSSVQQHIRKVSANVIFKIVKKFLFVFKFNKDHQRFLFLCKFLLQNTESESATKNSYVALSVHKQFVKLWIIQIKKMLWLVCKYIDERESSKDPEAVSAYLHMLLIFTDVSHWRSLKKQTVLHAILAQMCNSILCELHQRGSVCIIGSFLERSNLSILHHAPLLASCTVVMRLLSSAKFNDDSVASFTMSVMSVPSLIWHLNQKANQIIIQLAKSEALAKMIALLHSEGACTRHGITPSHDVSVNKVTRVLCIFANLVQLLVLEEKVFNQRRVEAVALMNQLLKFLFDNTARQKTSKSTWHVVLGYFSGGKSSNFEAMLCVKKQIELLWQPAFVRSVFHDVLTLKSLHDEAALPTQAEQIVNRSKNKVKLSNKLSSLLKKIATSRPQRALLPTGGRKLEYAEVKNTCNSCLLYRRALSIFTKQLQLEMLTGLTFMDEVLCRLWRFICELGPAGGLQLFLSSLTLPANVAEPYFAVFTLFCDMTAHILSILDDVEFYEQQVPFHLEELVTISAFLRQFVFKVIWGCIVTDAQSAMYSIFDSAHTLLMMLYDRDARRAFTPINHWLCKDVKPSLVRSEVEKGCARAKLVLQKIPFVIPHKDRVLLFNSFVTREKSVLGITSDGDASLHIKVRRSRLVEDGFDYLSGAAPNALKGIIRVKFFNDLGLDEAGIDQDGVFKEFLEEIIKKVFNPDMNLFKITTGGESKLYPSPLSYLQDNHLDLFAFVGRMLGKAVYEGIVLDIPFANFFLRSLLTQQHTMLYSPIDELPSLDVEFYKNLTWIKRYEGDIADLGLTFTYEEDIMGKVESHDLVPGGAAIQVTNENRIMYIHTLAHYRMHTQIQQQTRAFVNGFRSIIAQSWTAMFSAPELQRLISGDNVDMDLSDLRRHVVYYGGFHSTHRVVRWLWDILEQDYNPAQRAAFLKFVTSCSRPPLLGFAQLNPQFSIRCVEVPDEEDTGDTVATVLRGFFRLSTSKSGSRSQRYPHRLPTASTCFNLLKLPNYPNKDVLREKLKQAIANNTGFELS